jgi:hypothetical protein
MKLYTELTFCFSSFMNINSLILWYDLIFDDFLYFTYLNEKFDNTSKIMIGSFFLFRNFNFLLGF